MVFAGTLSDGHAAVRDAARRAREAAAQRRVAELRARDVDGARLRIPLRLSRPAAHGDRAGAARARVRSRPRARRCRAWSTTSTTTDGTMELLESPAKLPDTGGDRPHRGAVREGAHHGAGRVHRADHDARHRAARRLQEHDVPRHGARRVRLGVSARRDHPRLLRQAEDDQPRLRERSTTRCSSIARAIS